MAVAAVYTPSVYDSLPDLASAATTFEQRDPQEIIENEIGFVYVLLLYFREPHANVLKSQLFLKHEVYNELAMCLLHRHFNMSASEKLVELGAVSSPWQYAQDDSNVVGGSVVPRSWVFCQGRLFPFEFGYNEGLTKPVYKAMPDKPAFYTELNELLVKHGLEDLLGLTLNTGDAMPGTVKLEKTFDRSNVIFTLPYDEGMKETVTAQWNYSGVGNTHVPLKRYVSIG